MHVQGGVGGRQGVHAVCRLHAGVYMSLVAVTQAEIVPSRNEVEGALLHLADTPLIRST